LELDMTMLRRAAGRMLILALPALLAACGSSASSATPTAVPSHAPTPVPTLAILAALPTGFPTSWVDKPSAGPLLLSTESDGLRAHYTGSLLADDGTSATYQATYLDHRVPVATITCGGGTYRNVFTSTDPTLTFTIEIPGWGSGSITATKRVVVYSSSGDGSSPPVCDKPTGGTYQLTFGGSRAAGTLSGTWQVDAKGRIVLAQPPARTRASGSAAATPSP
jgi:hypothetical protein